MTNSLYTQHGHNMFEVSSLIQKAIRRSNKDYACYAANELAPRFRNYLWKRLLCVSVEDCYDLITNKIVALKQADDAQNLQSKSSLFIEKAIGILLATRKNRDADYFACNLLNSRDRIEFPKDEYVGGNAGCYTKNGHDMFLVAGLLERAITGKDDVRAGYLANELMVRYREFLWKRIVSIASNLNYQPVTNEIVALKKADDMQPTTSPRSSIFVAKAVTVLLKVVRYGCCSFYVNDFAYPVVHLKDYDNRHMVIPDYVFDCHTHRGKQMGRTKREFIYAEQSALTPYKEGEYDKCGWDRYFYLEKNGFYDKNNITPRPDENRMKEVVDGCVQQSLFD